MDRRRFLVFVGLAAVSPRLEAGPAQGEVEEEPSTPPCDFVGDALRRARERGRPLLVLAAAPEDSDFGALLGACIDNANDLLLSRLAPCDTLAARPDELARHVEGLAETPLPWCWLVETDRAGGAAWRARRIGGERAQGPRRTDGQGFYSGEASEAAWLRQRNAAVASVLYAAIAPDTATLERLAAQARAAFTAEQARLMERVLSGLALPDADLAERGAAILSLAVSSGKLEREAFAVVLTGARERWIKNAPPGTKWARRGDCGTEIEDGRALVTEGFLCGAGYVGSESRRFLMTFTQLEEFRAESRPDYEWAVPLR